MTITQAWLASIPGRGVAAVLACAAMAVGCVSHADESADTTMATDLQLQPGQSALVSANAFEIGFVAVTSDSRCGKGEVCIWEGDAVVRIWLQGSGEPRQELELHTAVSQGPYTAGYAGYSIRLISLFPAAVSGRSIAPGDYLATFRIARGDSPEGDSSQ